MLRFYNAFYCSRDTVQKLPSGLHDFGLIVMQKSMQREKSHEHTCFSAPLRGDWGSGLGVSTLRASFNPEQPSEIELQLSVYKQKPKLLSCAFTDITEHLVRAELLNQFRSPSASPMSALPHGKYILLMYSLSYQCSADLYQSQKMRETYNKK